MGQIVYDQVFRLSRKVNTELLEPISRWLSDEDWMIRFEVYNQHVPNWAEYKRRQREWNEHQKQLLAERMRLYWQEIHRKRALRAEISAIIPRTYKAAQDSEATQDHYENADYLTAILEPFSPQEEKKTETREMFIQARQLSAADILPWKLIIQSSINKNRAGQTDTVPFSDLPSYFDNKKADTAAKLTHLLFLESEGKLSLCQHEPFGEITIELSNQSSDNTDNASNIENPCSDNSNNNNQPDSSFIIIDQHAEEYPLNWNDLSDAQKNKVIADLKENRILCRVII